MSEQPASERTQREQIVHALREAAARSGYRLIGPPADKMFDAQADEVIRIAEWARGGDYQTIRWWEGEIDRPPLTLPPDDWKVPTE